MAPELEAASTSREVVVSRFLTERTRSSAESGGLVCRSPVTGDRLHWPPGKRLSQRSMFCASSQTCWALWSSPSSLAGSDGTSTLSFSESSTLAGALIENIHELLQLPALSGRPFGGCVRNAVLYMKLEDGMADPTESSLRRCQLLENVDARSWIFDHAANTSNLAFDAVQP